MILQSVLKKDLIEKCSPSPLHFLIECSSSGCFNLSLSITPSRNSTCTLRRVSASLVRIELTTPFLSSTERCKKHWECVCVCVRNETGGGGLLLECRDIVGFIQISFEGCHGVTVFISTLPACISPYNKEYICKRWYHNTLVANVCQFSFCFDTYVIVIIITCQ